MPIAISVVVRKQDLFENIVRLPPVGRGLPGDPDVSGAAAQGDQGRARRAALVHRCHRHKERNVTALLPEPDRPAILVRIRGAWAPIDADLAEQRLELLASELERAWPDAAASLREGMADALTLMRLGIGGQLSKTLCSTNPCESMIEIVRHTQRSVKRWQDGDMRKRWTAAGMLVAEQQFRRIIGYRNLAKLVIAIERHTILVANKTRGRQELDEPVTV
jgi:putative transposase